jgi:hypothetical protein
VNIQNRRYDTFYSFAEIDQQSSAHAARRRNDEHEQTFEYREEFKSFDHLIDENQSINSIFID